jgi:NAD-dependent DNA ligase
MIDGLLAAGVQVEDERQIIGKLSGQNFVVTGVLHTFSREVAGEKIQALGGNLQSAVTKDTDYLVVGENTGQSKLTKAAQYGTKQINEAELIKLLEG